MSGLKVLIFEYDRPFADALERAFTRRGCTVRIVDDGQVGLDVALDDRPGLIILAIELPRMNGFAVCNRIKKHSDLKDIPLMIVSSDSPPETFEQHSKLRTRAEDYAHKPIDPEALIARAAMFVSIPELPDAEITVDDEAIEESVDDLAINIDDDMGGLSDAAFDSILMESIPPESAAALLEPLPEPQAGHPGARSSNSDDFEDYTMVSSSAELPLNLSDIARAVQANPLPQAPAALVAPPLLGGSPSLGRVGVAPPLPPPTLPPFAAPAPMLNEQSPSGYAEAERLQRRVDELSRDLAVAEAARQRVVDLTADNERLRAEGDELARVAKDLEEKTRTAPVSVVPARPGGISTREFLELRESLNRKDKDILARDREILELRDKVLQAEMSTADIDDRLNERDQEVITVRQAGDAVRAELLTEVERRSEIERALAESRQAAAQGEASLQQQVADAEAKRVREAEVYQRELTEVRTELAAAVAASAAQIVAREAAEATLREGHAAALEAVRAESTTAVAQQAAAQRAELEAALSSLRSEHAQVVDSVRADHATEVLAVNVEHARAFEAKGAEHGAAVESMRAAHEQSLAALASDHAAVLTVAAAAAAAAVVAEASMRSELTDRIESLDIELGAARAEGTALASELVTARATMDTSAREVVALRDRLDAMERRKANSEALLDRARQAMEIAAGLVHAATHESPAASDEISTA